MISNPYDHEHPLFMGQRGYSLIRACIDTGDERQESSVVLHFQHNSGRLRSLRFLRVRLSPGIGEVASIGSFMPVYVANVSDRGWEGATTVEVGCADPGAVWFHAEDVVVASDPSDGMPS